MFHVNRVDEECIIINSLETFFRSPVLFLGLRHIEYAAHHLFCGKCKTGHYVYFKIRYLKPAEGYKNV